MNQYHDLIKHILTHGVDKGDRTGTGTRSIFGYQMRFEMSAGFPLLTTKKLHLKSIVHELLWFLKGDANVKYLQNNGVHIWDEWADVDGNLGPVYGAQWRDWNGDGYDQIEQLVHDLINNPNSRRHIVSAWNVGELGDMRLPPCHCLWQCYVANGELSLLLYQRSADVFLGVPFNIASYALLLMMLAKVCNLKPGALIWTGGDVHIYANHFDQVKEQITRTPRPLPKMVIADRGQTIDDFRYEDFGLAGYDPHPHIAGKVAV